MTIESIKQLRSYQAKLTLKNPNKPDLRTALEAAKILRDLSISILVNHQTLSQVPVDQLAGLFSENDINPITACLALAHLIDIQEEWHDSVYALEGKLNLVIVSRQAEVTQERVRMAFIYGPPFLRSVCPAYFPSDFESLEPARVIMVRKTANDYSEKACQAAQREDWDSASQANQQAAQIYFQLWQARRELRYLESFSASLSFWGTAQINQGLFMEGMEKKLESLKLLEQLYRLSGKTIYKILIAKIYSFMSAEAEKAGCLDESILLKETAARTYGELGYTLDQAYCLSTAGRILLDRRDFSRALTVKTHAARLFGLYFSRTRSIDRFSDRSQLARLEQAQELRTIARQAFRLSRYEQSFQASRQAAEIFEQLGRLEDQAYELRTLAQHQAGTRRFNDAYKSASQAAELFGQLGKFLTEIFCLKEATHYLSDSKKSPDAAREYAQAAEKLQAYMDKEEAQADLEKLDRIYCSLLENAARELSQAIKAAKRRGQVQSQIDLSQERITILTRLIGHLQDNRRPEKLSQAHSNRARTLIALAEARLWANRSSDFNFRPVEIEKNLQDGMADIQHSIKYWERQDASRTKTKRSLAFCLSYQGKAAQLLGHQDLVIESKHRAAQLFESSGENFEAANDYYWAGLALYRAGQKEHAQSCLQKACQLFGYRSRAKVDQARDLLKKLNSAA